MQQEHDSSFTSSLCGTIYIGSGSNDPALYALDSLTGSLKWKYTTGGGIYSSPGFLAALSILAQMISMCMRWRIDRLSKVEISNRKLYLFFTSSFKWYCLYWLRWFQYVCAWRIDRSLKWEISNRSYVGSSPAVSGVLSMWAHMVAMCMGLMYPPVL